MKKYNSIALLCVSVLAGCASHSDKQTYKFESELYDGRPVETFSSDAAPLTEMEAIKRGDYALKNNNSDLALYEYLRSLDFAETQYSDKTLYTVGRIHQSRGNFELAERAYLMALQQNPNNYLVLEQLGTNYSKQGKIDEGRTYFQRAINADQLRLSSRLQIDSRSRATKIEELSCDRLSPVSAYIGLGILDDVKAEHKTAQALYAQALKIDPKSVKALMNIGYSYYMSGEYSEAKRFTLAALEQEPDNKKALNNLALIYLAQGEIPRALNAFMRKMEAPEALNNVGYFLMLQGKPEQAIPYLQQAIDKKPSYYRIANENLERALSEVRAGAATNSTLVITQ